MAAAQAHGLVGPVVSVIVVGSSDLSRVTIRLAAAGIPGIEVAAENAVSRQWLQVQPTHAFGRYTLYVPPTQVVVRAYAAGCAMPYCDNVETPEDAAWLDMGSVAELGGIDFQLAAGRIRGEVRGASDTAPLADVPISVFEHGTGNSLVLCPGR